MKTIAGKDLDALGVILGHGAAAAGERFEKMLGLPCRTQATRPCPLAPDVSPFPQAGHKERQAYYIFMPGVVFLALFPADSPLIESYLTRQNLPLTDDPKLGEQVLHEFANILVSGIVDSLVDRCGMKFFLAAPRRIAGRNSILINDTCRKFLSSGVDGAVAGMLAFEADSCRVEVLALLDSQFLNILLPNDG